MNLSPTTNAPAEVYRSREGLGVWEHRGKVACAGIGMSPIDRRWDEKDLSKSVGVYALIAAQMALDDAGISRDDVDGVVTDPTGMGDHWGPVRPYFAPPYDSEDGLSEVTADWLVRVMNLRNVKFTSHGPGCISNAMNVAAQAVGDRQCHTCLVVRGTGNLVGRYHHTEVKEYDGPGQWQQPWGWGMGGHGGPARIAFQFNQYCRRYNKNPDMTAPFVVNQHRNGLMQPWGYYTQHRPELLTVEDYLASRWIVKPMRLYDNDYPVQTAGAFLFTTAERAKDMKQPPVYILNHACNRDILPRSTVETLDETLENSESIARKCLEGAGLTNGNELDVFNPYDGFAQFFQHYLEGFHWRGVKRGEALDFYAGDISVEGPNPLSPSGGNLGNGRTRWWGHLDCVQQLRGQAGKRQIRTRCETGVSGAFTPFQCYFTVWSKSPD